MHGIQQEELSEQLLRAVISGNIEETEGLIKSGASVHSANQHNKTLLHCAAEKGFEKITELLLNRGANVHAINESKATALHFAAQGGHEGVIKLLLEENARIDEVEREYGLAPLHYAAQSGYTGAVRLLLEQDASINLVDYGGCTPLHYAAKNGHEDVVELLLEWKSAVNTIDCNGKVPKDYATKRGFQKIVSLLADKEKNANNLVSQSRLMPLYLAVLEKNEGMVEFLIKTEGVNVNEIDQKYGDSPLRCAIKNRDLKMVKLLLTAENVNVNVVDQNGYTLLHLAVRNGNTEITKLLLEKRSMNVNAVDKDGRTPLHHSAQRGYMNLVEYLIKREANVNAVDNFKNTPLHLIAHSGYIQDNGAWINIEEAAKLCHKNTVELLFKKGANLNAVDNQMQTPLHIAAEGGHSYLVEVLLKKGAAVNLADNEGNTPLHCVGNMDGGKDDEEVIKLLLKAGADVNLVNAEGDTPLSGYKLESCHFNAGIKLIIDHVKKLQAAKFPINQKNKHFMGELVKEDYFLYAFLEENNTDALLKTWEKNEYTRNKFIGKDLNEEKKLKKVLKERYLQYADTLINKADEVRKKIFLHNYKPLTDALSKHYERDFQKMTFADIRNFFEIHNNIMIKMVKYERVKGSLKEWKIEKPLANFVKFENVKKRDIPRLESQAAALQIKDGTLRGNLNCPTIEQHRSNPLTNQYT